MLRASLLLMLTAAACDTAPPAQPAVQPAPALAPAAVAEPAPPSEAVARADALLEDLKRRQEAQEQYDRNHPPGQDETSWRDKARALDLTLNEALIELAKVEDLKNGDADAQAAYKKRFDAVTQARLAIEKLSDEARKAGVPPEWLK